MNDTATLSHLFAGIQPDLDQVDITFEERATSGLEILNSASMHALFTWQTSENRLDITVRQNENLPLRQALTSQRRLRNGTPGDADS